MGNSKFVQLINKQKQVVAPKNKGRFNLEAKVNSGRNNLSVTTHSMKRHNYSAGPCILPDQVLKAAAKGVLNYNNSNLSILEISHRSPEFIAIIEEARALVLELMGLTNKGYQALFLHGGASTQFMMVPYNLMNGSAAYLDTGAWANAAIKEAQFFGQVIVAASSKEQNYNHIPKQYTVDQNVSYFHCTSNNTIFGTQMQDFPKLKVPMVCDMSSDIFSRTLDFSAFDLIYAGAQKNIGPAGVTLVVVKEAILGKTDRKIPSILDYTLHINKNSMYNTPPVFAIYTALLNLQWLKKTGGLAVIEKINRQKASLLYQEIDRNSLFTGTANTADRSIMNVTFVLKDPKHAILFDQLWQKAGIYGLAGHRTVGGYRASIYNALPLESVQTLVAVMQDLEKNS